MLCVALYLIDQFSYVWNIHSLFNMDEHFPKYSTQKNEATGSLQTDEARVLNYQHLQV